MTPSYSSYCLWWLASFCRVKSYISYGWAMKYLVNPDTCDAPPVARSVSADFSFTDQAYSQPTQVSSFNHGYIISYFVFRTAMDGLPADDIKSINKGTKHLNNCGHVQVSYTIEKIFEPYVTGNAKGSYLQYPNVY